MRLSRSVETLADLHEFVAMCDTAGVPDDAVISGRIRIGGRVRDLWADAPNMTSRITTSDR